MPDKKYYYLNDYFDIFNNNRKELEFMKTDIYDKNNNYILEIDIPGIDKNNIKIKYEVGYLTVSIEKNSLSSTPESYVRRERFYGNAKRTFYIGIKKFENIKAIYKDGILYISFPKLDEKKTNEKNITVL